jgi:hypothetical protein
MQITFSRLVRGPLLMVSLVAAGGCSTFSKDYDAAVASSEAGVAAPSITGPWEGEWRSKGGHQGRLRAILSVDPVSNLPGSLGSPYPQNYLARFEAKFWKIFTAHYDVTLRVVHQADQAVKLSGAQDLGWLAGGKYHYEATVTPEQFDTAYDSRVDTGEFHMRRP